MEATLSILRNQQPTPIELASEYQMNHDVAQFVAVREGWADVSPEQMLNRARTILPDQPQLFSDSRSAFSDRPAELELYFLSKVPIDTGFTVDTPHAGALRMTESIKCLRDEVRTGQFLRGVASSVDTLASQQSGPIEVLEAGTGAIPVMLLQAALRDERVRATGLELNPRSAAIARQIVSALKLEDRVTILEADAIRYKPARPVDLLISETMHSALSSEPLVQILGNLQPYVRPRGITLPSQVDVLAAVTSIQNFHRPSRYARLANQPLPILAADWKTVVRYRPGDNLELVNFTIQPGELSPGGYLVMVASEVMVGDYPLRQSQSVITAPRKLRRSNGADLTFGAADKISQIEVSYPPGSLLRDVAKLTAA